MNIVPEKQEQLHEILQLMKEHGLPIPRSLQYFEPNVKSPAAALSLQKNLSDTSEQRIEFTSSIRSHTSKVNIKWLETFAQLAVFWVQQNRWPSADSDNRNEKQLANWCRNMRQQYEFSILGNKHFEYLTGINFPFSSTQ